MRESNTTLRAIARRRLFEACLIAAFACKSLEGGGFVDVNLYPELTEENRDSVFTVNLFSNLPGRFHYFSLTNIINRGADSEFSGDYHYYTEQNLRWAIREDQPWDLTTQWNFRSGKDKERIRFGARWRLSDARPLESFFESIHLTYSVNFHLVQLDHEDADVWQMEHAFRKTFPEVSDRIYLAGFVDHTFGEDLDDRFPDSPMVGEVQFGCRLSGNWNLVAEYRVNEYRRSSTSNLGLGVQYLYRW
ncbi:hypothetical protein QEH56_22840 [Pelagicoccus enzymogenes]|uniref:hypothetical protein n=1 Tax=Pelagicoccus enzymogenes TaxID=2773457 RepID=UPI00280C4701|nr:hypothetical protein [Pelagicoccus enzymogenes]MDQ8201021.1 hypothetical protein [Pelagicoccus enzymogenes]